MKLKPTRLFLSVTTVPYRLPAGTDPFTYREKRPLRHRASWWTRGTTTELYRSKIAPSQEEAVCLARKWLERENKSSAGGPADTRLIDTTDQPQRYGYSHDSTEPPEQKTAVQLDAEIAESLARKS